MSREPGEVRKFCVMGHETAVEMFVGGLVLDPNTQSPVVVLKDESGQIALPIWIGVGEATSIASAIKQIAMQRPLTHDLMYDVFSDLGVKIERVIITELKEQTYYAELVLSHGDKALIIDSRPSDAIALSLRAAAPIFVTPQVLEQAKVLLTQPPRDGGSEGDGSKADEKGAAPSAEDVDASGQGPDFRNIDKDKWKDILGDLDPDDFKYKM